MSKRNVDPVTGYLRAYNGAAHNGQGKPSMDGLSTDEQIRVGAFLDRADPQGRAVSPQKANPVAESSGPPPEEFAIGAENAAKLQALLGNLATPDIIQQGEQQ